MWAHYTNGHKGFCVEYDEHLTDGLKYNARENGYISVEYSSFMPIVAEDNATNSDDEWFMEAISHKSSVWESEKEIRMLFCNLTTDERGHLHNFNPEYTKAIYIGKNAECDLCTQLVKFCRDNNIPCYKMKPSACEYVLIAQKVY